MGVVVYRSGYTHLIYTGSTAVVKKSTVGFTGLEQSFHRIAVLAESAREFLAFLEIASRCFGSGAAYGQPDRGIRSLLGTLMTAEAEVVA